MATTKIRGDQIRLQATGALEHNSLASTGGLQVNVTGATYLGGATADNADLILIQDMSVTGKPLRHVKVSELPGGAASSLAADNITAGDAAVSIATSAGAVTVDSNAAAVTIDGHTGVTIQSSDSGDVTINAAADVVIGTMTGDVTFKDGGTAQLKIDMDTTAGEQRIELEVDGDDLVFYQYDGTEVIRFDDTGMVQVKDNLLLKSDSAVLSLGDGSDATLTHDGTTGLTIAATPISINSTGDLTLDSSTDIVIDAAGGNIEFKDAGVAQLTIDMDSLGDGPMIQLKVDADDLTFFQFDGTEVIRFTDSADVEVKDDLTLKSDAAVLGFGADTDVTLTHVADTGILLNSTRKIQFSDSSQYIGASSGADLDLAATTDINMDCTTVDVNGALDVSGTSTLAAVTCSTIVASGIVKTDDTTAATSTTDGSLQTDGGLSVALDAVVGDDLILLSDSAQIAFGADSEITLAHAADTGLVLAGNGVSANPRFELKNTNNDATGGTLRFNKNGASAADDDVLGNIDFVGEDDASNVTTYARILAQSDDVTSGAEEGSLEFYVAENDGTLTKGMDIKGLSSDGNITVDISTHDGSAGGLMLGSTLVTSTAAELNFLDGATAGSVVNSKAVVYGGSGQLAGSLSTAAQGGVTSLGTLTGLTVNGDLTVSDGTNDFDIASHDGTNGLALAGTIVTATAAELNIMDGGTAATSTTVVNADRIPLNDNGTMVQVAMSDIKTYIGAGAADDLEAGDAAVSVSTTSGDITVDSNAGSVTIDGHTGVTIQSTNSGDVTVNSAAGVTLSPGNGDLTFSDGGTAQLALDMDGTAGEVIMQLKVDSDDFVFKQYDGTEVFRVEDNGEFDIAGGLGSSGVTVSAAGALSADGRIITDDTTAATSTTDGSIQTDGGLSVALDAVVGDDLILLSDSAQIAFGADSEITLAHVADSGLLMASSVSAVPVFELKNTNADATGATLKFNMNGASAADADVLGNIDFVGEDSATNVTTYARILAKSDDVTTGEEEGSLEFYVAEYDGTLTKGMDIKGLGSNGNVTVDITTHDGSAGGLMLAGTLITKTASEINNLVSTSAANTFTADQIIGGTTPKLTIGDGGAEDTMLVFDGNAIDYYIGLDDTDDKLHFGEGSTAGTTSAFTIDTNQLAAFSADVTVGDDLSLVSDAAVLNFGAGNDVTFTHDGGTGMDVASAGDFDIAVSAGDATFTVADTKTLILGQTGASELKLSPHSTAGSELASLINTAGTTDGSDAAGSILLSAVAGGLGLAWADGKDLWAEGGSMMFVANEDKASCIQLHADAGTSQTIHIVNDAGTSATEGAAAVQLLASAGGVNIKSGLDAANAILLTADGGTSETIKLHADQGTAATSIELASDAGGISILAGNTTHGVKIATGTSGVPVSIGHSTSETTINDNLTVTGDLTINGTTTTVNSTTMTVDDPILTLGGDSAPGSDDNKDRGVVFRWHNGSSAKIGFMGYDDSAGVIALASDVSLSSEVTTISSYATVRVATVDIGGATVLSSTGSAKVASPVAGNGLQHSAGALYVDWVRDVFTSGSLTASTYTSVDGVSLSLTSGLTATLTQTPLEDAAVMVFLNGMLQRPSASHDAGASLGGAYDYKLSSGVIRMVNLVDNDAVVQVSYVKQ